MADSIDTADHVNDDEESEVSIGILPINPIIEKDKEIAELVKTVEALQSKVEEIPNLVKGLEDAKAENSRMLSVSKQVGRRLSVSRRANDQKMISLI